MVNRIKRYIWNFKDYYYMLTVLVKRDIERKYKGSALGIVWSLLKPMLTMIVLTIVFSTLFKRKIENFPVYLLSGRLLYSYFSSSTTGAMKSIIASGNLLKKIYVPKYMLTLSHLISDFIMFLISLIDLVIIALITKAPLTYNLAYAPIYLVLLFLFVSGIGLLMATVAVFFRDMEHLWGVFTMIIMYASAIFYPPDIIPEKYAFILDINPLFYYIQGFRDAVYFGVALNYRNLLFCLIISVVSMVIGVVVFEKNQDKFIFNI